MTQTPAIDEPAPGVFRLVRPYPRLTSVNAYLFAEPTAAYLVDTGYIEGDDRDAYLAMMRAFLDAGGLRPEALAGVVLTHAHRDHSGGAGWLVDAFGPPLYAGRREVASVRRELGEETPVTLRRVRNWLVRAGTPGGVISEIIEERTTRVSLMSRDLPEIRPLRHRDVLGSATAPLTVVASPGHSDGHIALMQSANRCVVTGDAVLPPQGGNAHVGAGFFAAAPDPLQGYLRALDHLSDLDAEVVLCGHGTATEPLPALCARHRTHQHRQLRRVLMEMTDRSSTYDLAAGLVGHRRFSALRPRARVVAMSETVARLSRLAACGLVESGLDDRVQRWQRATPSRGHADGAVRSTPPHAPGGAIPSIRPQAHHAHDKELYRD